MFLLLFLLVLSLLVFQCRFTYENQDLAEGVGFEPTVGFPTLDFESSALNRTQPPFQLLDIVDLTLGCAICQPGPVIAKAKHNASVSSARRFRPEELEKLNHLAATDVHIWVRDELTCAREFNLSILGGCCGTDERYIEALAKVATSTKE